MKYLKEMESKWGFNDGEAVPPGAELYRKAYIIALNHYAKELGSNSRIVAFNRMGMHNWCSIFFIDEKYTKDFLPEDFFNPSKASSDAIHSCDGKELKDDTMDTIIENVSMLNLDDFIEVTAKLNEVDLVEGIKNHSL